MWHSVWNDARMLNRVAAVLALFATVLFASAAVKTLAARPEFAIRSVVVIGCDGVRSTMSSCSSAAAALRSLGGIFVSSPYSSRVAASSPCLIVLPGAVKSTRQPQLSALTFSTTTFPTNSAPR